MLVVPENQAIRRFSKQYEQINGYYNQHGCGSYSCEVRPEQAAAGVGAFPLTLTLSPEGRGPYCANIVTPATNRLIQPLTLYGDGWDGSDLAEYSPALSPCFHHNSYSARSALALQGEGDRRFSSCRIISSTASSLQSISLCQKRSTVQLCDSSQLVRTVS